MREYSLDEVKETITLDEDNKFDKLDWDEFYHIYARKFDNGFELYTDEGERLGTDEAIEWMWNLLPDRWKNEPFNEPF